MSHSVLRPHGYSVERTPDGKFIIKNIYTCCHCQYTWEAETGSLGGKMAGGFCGRCVGYICKNPDCEQCVPWEQRLENLEAGRHYLAPRVARVSVPDLDMVLANKAPPPKDFRPLLPPPPLIVPAADPPAIE